MIGRASISCLVAVAFGSMAACAGAASPDDAPTVLSGISSFDDSSSADESTDDESSASSESEGSTTSSTADDVATSSSTSDDTGEPETTGEVGGICIANDSDSPCTACSKTNCCGQLVACSSDTGCNCFMMCVATSADVFGCGTQCAVDLFAPGPVGDLVSCSSGPCGAACT